MKYRLSAEIRFTVDADSRAEAYIEGGNRLIEANLPGFDLVRLDVYRVVADRPVKLESGKVVGQILDTETTPEGIGVSARIDDPDVARAVTDPAIRGGTYVTGPDGVTYGPFGDAFAPGSRADGQQY